MRLTITEYAAYRKRVGLRGASRPAVYKALKKGWISKDENGFIDVLSSDERWAKMSLPRIDAPPPAKKKPEEANENVDLQARKTQTGVTFDDEEEVDEDDYYRHRARREKANADKAELIAAELRGRLVAVEAVERAWFGVLRGVRQQLRAIPARVSGGLASETSEHAIRKLLTAEIDATLTALGDEAPVG